MAAALKASLKINAWLNAVTRIIHGETMPYRRMVIHFAQSRYGWK
jgi:hypothetical protein